MMNKRFKSYYVIAISILIALMLSLLPLPDWARWARPCWVAMVLIYWTMAVPYLVSIRIAWCVGIMLDVLQDTLLGQNALALTVIIYLVAKAYKRLRLYPVQQQALVVFFLLLFYQLLLFWPQVWVSHINHNVYYWLASVTSFILWPWIYYLLRSVRRNWQVA